jgi:hypothetical protein
MACPMDEDTFAVDDGALRRAAGLLAVAAEEVRRRGLPQEASELAAALPFSMSAWACADLAEGWRARLAVGAADLGAAGALLRAVAEETAALDRFLADAADGVVGDEPPTPVRRGAGPVML